MREQYPEIAVSSLTVAHSIVPCERGPTPRPAPMMATPSFLMVSIDDETELFVRDELEGLMTGFPTNDPYLYQVITAYQTAIDEMKPPRPKSMALMGIRAMEVTVWPLNLEESRLPYIVNEGLRRQAVAH